MTLMESKTTSKTSCLKALIIRAWRERWSDVQWGKNIKTVLPRGVSGDVYNLADCILQQALVGQGANQLVLSYLMHSLSAQLVSTAAVLQRISKFTQFHKLHCVLSLLDFLQSVLPGVTCCGKADETKLASALLATTHWLLQVLQYSGTSFVNLNSLEAQAAEKAAQVLKQLTSSPFNLAMMCLARYNDSELYSDICRRCCELEPVYQSREDIIDQIRSLIKLDVSSLSPENPPDIGPGCLIQAWLAVQLVRSPDISTEELADHLRLIGRLKGYSEARLYCEIIRGSFLTLRDVGQTTHESQWGAFAFLKVPQVLGVLVQEHHLHILHHQSSQLRNDDEAGTRPVYTAVEMLIRHPSLLDGMDTSNACSSLECLLGELEKCRLMSNIQVRALCEQRSAQTAPPKMDQSMTSTAGIPKVIICAEPTLTGILKTLSTDYHKIQDAILGMLHQVLTGKSFELILAVATVEGQLKTLVQRLIRFNECSKVLQSGDKARAQLFDISFLMLVAIVQNYGAAAVLEPSGNPETESLLESWVRVSMVESDSPKAPQASLNLCDPSYVDALLQQFNAGESEFKAPIKWQEVLFNIPGVMKEVLVAWEQGALLVPDVKRILDAVRGRMCCLPLVAAAWLCNYMRTAPNEAILKPINMVQQLLAPPLIADDENLRERWTLTCEIIQKMQRDVQLMLRPKTAAISYKHLISTQPASERLSSIWKGSVSRGWLDYQGAQTVHTLLDTAGSRWLVAAVIQELLGIRNKLQLERGVDLALALFHADIKQCASHLLTDSLPQLLLANNSRSEENSSGIYEIEPNNNYHQINRQLMEPQLSALARLTGCCVYAAAVKYDKAPVVPLQNDMDCDPTASKIRRPNSSLGVNSDLASLALGTVTNVVGTLETERNPPVQALRQLLTSLEASMQDGSITQQMYFVLHLLKELVACRPPHHRGCPVLGSVPASLVSLLLRTLPTQFTPSMLLQLYDVNTTSGRVNIARDLCVLRNHQLRHQPSTVTPLNVVSNSNMQNNGSIPAGGNQQPTQ